MIEQTRVIEITSNDDTYTFRVVIHKAETPDEQLIEPEFYKKFAGGAHNGPHLELELIEAPVLNRPNTTVSAHVHINPVTERKFVCFTGNIPTLESAIAVLRVWCVGVVYTMANNEDFGPLVQQHGPNFIETMQDRYGITLLEDKEVSE